MKIINKGLWMVCGNLDFYLSNKKNPINLFFLFSLVVLILFSMMSCKDSELPAIYNQDPFHSNPPTMPKKEAFLPPTPTIENEETATHFPVPQPPFSEGIYPCSGCHADMEVNSNRRVLENAHDDIKLHHDEQNRWCLDCHNPSNRDVLRLASGQTVSFDESYRLCGQCHGTQYRDWRLGIHGKRTGMWNGEKQYLLCAHCHNPHSPRYKPIKPEPAPERPELIR